MTVKVSTTTFESILSLLCSLFKYISFRSFGFKLFLDEFRSESFYFLFNLKNILLLSRFYLKSYKEALVKSLETNLSASACGHFIGSLNELIKITFQPLISISDLKGLICLFKHKTRSIILALPSIIDSQSGTIEAPLMFELNDPIDNKIIHTTNLSADLVNSYHNINETGNYILSNEEERLNIEKFQLNLEEGFQNGGKKGGNYLLSKKIENKNARYNNPLTKFEDSSKYNLEIKGSSSSAEEEEIFASKSQEGLRETNYLSPHLNRSETDIKKKVRFSFVKMEAGDLNFRVTLSIKNEAHAQQQVYYKVDKNRFRKEKTIKLMVETLYRVDISFKPTQTLARAIVNGHEVKTTVRVHDSTASAYSLHLPTSNVQVTPKGHREEISFLIQLTNGLVLQTSLQTKFYKLTDTQRCEWGTTFHCIEYDCENYPESATIAVIRETFR